METGPGVPSFPLLFAASLLLGLSVAAPIGPINVEIIRRGLTQSSRAAFAMGCGAVSADCIYFSLALAGAGAFSAMSDSAIWRVAGLSLGAAMLTGLGVGSIRKVRSIREAPEEIASTIVPPGGESTRHVLSIYALGLALTLSNPMTIALWLSIAAGFTVSGVVSGTNLIRLAGVFSGALSWVCFVTALTAWARRWITPVLMQGINLASGLILIGYGLWFLFRIFVAP